MSATFLGYPRENGSIGVRNWVDVISIMGNCNPGTRTTSEVLDIRETAISRFGSTI